MKYSPAITIVLIIIWVFGVLGFLRSMYYLFKCSQNIKIGRELWVRVNPFSIFLVSNYTGIGNVYRKKAINNLFVGISSVILLFIIVFFAERMLL